MRRGGAWNRAAYSHDIRLNFLSRYQKVGRSGKRAARTGVAVLAI
jgi:hypothetical protein